MQKRAVDRLPEVERDVHSSATKENQPDEFDVYFARAALDASCNNFPEFGAAAADDDSDTVPVGRSSDGSVRPFLSVNRSGSAPRRSVSCKYPSRKKSVSPRRGSPTGSQLITQTGNGRSSDRGLDTTGLCAPLLGVWNRSSSAPQSRSSSWKKMKRPPSFRNIANDPASHGQYHHHHHQNNQHQHGGGGAGGGGGGAGGGNLEEIIIDKLQQLKLMKEADCCVVRSFNTSPKGDIVNKFDMFKKIGGTDQTNPVPSISSSSSSPAAVEVKVEAADHVTGKRPSVPQTTVEETGNGKVVKSARSGTGEVSKVVVIGQSHVGKTALIQQFMTSQYLAAVCTSFDDEADKRVCVVLNGEESTINFVDAGTPNKQEYLCRSDVDAYLLVYSITAPTSFRYVCEVLCDVRCADGAGGGGGGGGAALAGDRVEPVVILVANKSDLVRTKQVSEADAKYICSCLDCKYIEVSASLNHRVDDLLVGIVRQIKRNRDQRKHRRNAALAPEADDSRRCMKGAKEILKEFFRGDFCVPPSSNYDNLFEL